MLLAVDAPDLSSQELALPSALRRSNGLGRGWGLFPTLLLGWLSFGTLPLLAWPIRMRELFAGEAARLIEICRFVATRDATWTQRLGLEKAALRTAPRPMLWVLPILAASFLIIAAGMMVCDGNGRGFDKLVESTYDAGQSSNLDHPLGLLQTVFGVWTAVLVGGFLLHWLHVQMHYSAVRRFVKRFNTLLEMSGVRPIALPRRSIVPNVLWLVAGGAVTMTSAWWAVPMVLAGAAQRRDAYQMHNQLSRALANRVEALASVPVMPEFRCQTTRCHAELRTGARFCPRCGAPVNPVYAAAGVWA